MGSPQSSPSGHAVHTHSGYELADGLYHLADDTYDLVVPYELDNAINMVSETYSNGM